MAYWLYILICVDGTLYTGIATNVARRLEEHNGGRRDTGAAATPSTIRGRGARYTANRRPVRLAYAARHPSRSAAQSAEARTKRLNRQQKMDLIAAIDPAVLVAALTPAPGAGRATGGNTTPVKPLPKHTPKRRACVRPLVPV